MGPHAARGGTAHRAIRRYSARLDRLPPHAQTNRRHPQTAGCAQAADHAVIVQLGRDGHTLEPLVTHWYNATSGVDGGDARDRLPAAGPASLEQVLVLALRPFLARCAESLAQEVESSPWNHGHCPFCGWEPDFAVITP